MQFRQLGNTGESVSILNLGCMRFPNEEKSEEIVNRSIDLGINYFETSNRYCESQSEIWLGKALGERRKGVLVSTKSRPNAGSSDDTRRKIDESLHRLRTDRLDFYHAWSINEREMLDDALRPGKWMEGVLKAKEEGVIRHVGITSHATPAELLDILDLDLFEVLTVQYSVLLPAYREVVAKARQKGVGVIVMGPLAGGLLAPPVPTLLREALDSDDPVTGAFRYVLSDSGVSSVSSGMRSAEEVEHNCAVVNSLPSDLSMGYQKEVDRRIDDLLGDRLEEIQSQLCSGCRYCFSVCPQRLRVFNLFKAYNLVHFGGEPKNPEKLAANADEAIEQCTECAACSRICPQKIDVPAHLRRVRDYMRALADEKASASKM
ncbi:aldo/keto reductase [Candidatus Sumerlaeota bacterium]|nr:aldo/keto reductase [Candidatus Sumerlaeota bacterium]